MSYLYPHDITMSWPLLTDTNAPYQHSAFLHGNKSTWRQFPVRFALNIGINGCNGIIGSVKSGSVIVFVTGVT